MKKLKPGFLPPIIWSIISTILLCLPGSKFPKNDWAANLQLDKLIHIIMFGALMITWCWALTSRSNSKDRLKRLFLIQALIWIVYGIGMEFVQGHLVPRRDFEFGDILADTAGVIIGLVYVNQRFIKK